MPKVRIVLVEPREGGNVGAVARVMKNFGFTDLAIVGAVPALQPVATWWASGADDVVAAARTFDTLAGAIADAQFTVATTSSRGRTIDPSLTPREIATKASDLGDDQTLALVFGREDRGLTSEEAAACQRTAVVPTWGESPVMNLAQAVTVFVYELAQERLTRAKEPRELASQALLDRLHSRARALLLHAGFLHENNPDRIYDDLRAIAGRAELDRREAEILLGAVKQIEWKLQIATDGE